MAERWVALKAWSSAEQRDVTTAALMAHWRAVYLVYAMAELWESMWAGMREMKLAESKDVQWAVGKVVWTAGVWVDQWDLNWAARWGLLRVVRKAACWESTTAVSSADALVLH